MAETPIPTYEEVLELLAEQARAGSVTATVALERVLRYGPRGGLDDELERLLAHDE
jgi:hypothetical protein